MGLLVVLDVVLGGEFDVGEAKGACEGGCVADLCKVGGFGKGRSVATNLGNASGSRKDSRHQTGGGRRGQGAPQRSYSGETER